MTHAKAIPGKLVEYVFKRALGPELTGALLGELLEEGLDLSGPLADLYPRETWHRAIGRTASHLFPKHEGSEQLRMLGRHVMVSVQARHLIKGPWLAMARLAGPARTLRQAADYADQSPVKLSITEKAKRDFEIFVEEREQAEFLAGLLEGSVMVLGGKDVRVHVAGHRDHGTVFDVHWR